MAGRDKAKLDKVKQQLAGINPAVKVGDGERLTAIFFACVELIAT